MEEILGHYNSWFVALSIFMAIFASYTALDLAGRVSHSSHFRQIGWLFCGAFTMGLGIWSMHFIGMLAFELHRPMNYTTSIVILSILAAFVGAFIALYVVNMKELTWVRLIMGGLFMGIAIASMHYIGMEAMEGVHISYDPFLYVLSVLIAVGASIAALKISFELSQRDHSLLLRLVGAVIMGLAIAGMHYIGMEAASFHHLENAIHQEEGMNPILLAIGVGLATLCIQSFLVFGAFADRKMAVQAMKIHKMAYYDDLTDVPNRRYFVEKLNQLMRQVREEDRQVVVFFLDLNRFKIINDALGHNFGDLLLKEVALRLKERVGDGGLVARLGGDEFTILLEGRASITHAETLASVICQDFDQPFTVNNQSLYTPVSIGMAVAPEDSEDADEIMKYADMAMYEAKNRYKSHYQFYSTALEKDSKQLIREQELRVAIENDEFTLYYQPKINCETDELAGMEALVRWILPDGKIRYPREFIDLAEETGLMIPLGKRILERAFQQAKSWLDKGWEIPISVNVSPRQFQSEQFMDDISMLLEKYELPGRYIELEVTESMTMENVERSVRLLEALRALDISICIDDFGIGHSSFDYLEKFPIQGLKIDRSFIEGIHENEKREQITNAILAIGQSLGLEVTAEGVETERQVSYLKTKKCSQIQGFYYSQALPVAKIEEKYLNDLLSPRDKNTVS
ncbi:putative bifunctional diguanylate cyclase/phosphodiesterase [Shouchella shacheensis]|uniref:putative bifunctional diguanylate cyclase/phosphodiesterase n=1 Tax=Shouchella shacheensis TaxID=1649580 RepID=UPI00074054DE|nr:bifunctional diguanylate cyclase/phosphodiesterase [Shouchella shacheensis]